MKIEQISSKRKAGHVSAPPLPELDRGVTVEVWVEATGEYGEILQALVSQWGGEGTGTFSLRYSDPACGGAPAFLLNTEGGCLRVNAPESLALGFHHLAGTWNGSEIRLYVDGRLVARQQGGGPIASSGIPVAVGELQDGEGKFQGRILHIGFSPLACTPTEIKAIQHAHDQAAREQQELRIELDTYCVLDGRERLCGFVYSPEGDAAAAHITITDRHSGDRVWSKTLHPSKDEKPWALDIPLQFSGYHLVEVHDERGRHCKANLVIRKDHEVMPEKREEGFLDFSRKTVDRILSEQSMRLGRTADGALFVTTDLRTRKGYRSIGGRKDNTYVTYWFPEEPFEYETFRADHDLWPVLDDLTHLTGDARYRALTDGMIDAFRDFGFDPASGLLYFSEECDFDVAHRVPHGKRLGSDLPKFKSINDGPGTDMHIHRFRERLPKETHRWLRSIFYGLVTNPRTMDFNRFCMYGYDDREGRPSLTQNSGHCGFDSAAAAMIFFWSSCWAHDGDAECLDWAQRMTAKWAAVQDTDTGLIPNYFGASAKWEPGTTQHPGQYAEMRNAALTALLLLRAAVELRRCSGAESLALQLEDMGRRLALGVAEFSYDPIRRVFREHFYLNGRLFEQTVRYCFRTQEEKDEAVRRDPLMAQVAVYDGAGLYRNPNYYNQMAGSAIPFHLGEAAALCRDRELLARLEKIAADAVEEASKINGAFTPEGRWTFCATGWYIRLLLRLHELTGEARHLCSATELARREIAALDTVETPHWWRLRERAVFLNALLHLSKVAK